MTLDRLFGTIRLAKTSTLALIAIAVVIPSALYFVWLNAERRKRIHREKRAWRER